MERKQKRSITMLVCCQDGKRNLDWDIYSSSKISKKPSLKEAFIINSKFANSI
jgi:hypothetical protein